MFFCTFNAAAQTDSFAVPNDWIRRSDSLVEIQEYLLAHDYLVNANRALSLYESNNELYEFSVFYQSKRAALNVFLNNNVTDSARVDYYLKKAKEAEVDSGDYKMAAIFFFNALEFNQNEYISREDIRQFIQKLPLDTVQSGGPFVNLFITVDTFDLMKPDQFEWFQRSWSDSDDVLKSNRVLRRIDSLPFNGIIVKWNKPIKIYGVENELVSGDHFVHFKDGYAIADTTVFYRVNVDSSQTDFEKNNPMANWVWRNFGGRYFLYAYETNWGANYTGMDRNGVILKERAKVGKTEEVKLYDPHGNLIKQYCDQCPKDFAVTYNSEGDTLFYNVISGNKRYYFERRDNGTTLYEYEKGFGTDDGPIKYLRVLISSEGDTLSKKQSVNYKWVGDMISIANEENVENPVLLYTQWKNDTLVRYLNDHILFLDANVKQIEQDEFLRLIHKNRISPSPDSYIMPLDTSLTIKGETYHWIAYPEIRQRSTIGWGKAFEEVEKWRK